MQINTRTKVFTKEYVAYLVTLICIASGIISIFYYVNLKYSIYDLEKSYVNTSAKHLINKRNDGLIAYDL